MKESLIFILVAAAIGTALNGLSDAQDLKTAESRSALVIGNAAYADAPLRNPVNDARAMAKLLRKLGFKVISGENLDKRQMVEKLREFGDSMDSNSLGLFYYAGHGVQVKNQNYLIPVNANIQKEHDIEFEAIDADIILAAMGESNNGLNIVILDACRNNPFARSFRSATRGLAVMRTLSSAIIAYATSPGSVAADGEGANGLYTSELVKWMQEPGLRIQDVFIKVNGSVSEKSQGQQQPWNLMTLNQDNLYFIKPAERAAPPQDPTAAGQNFPTIDLSAYKSEAAKLDAQKKYWLAWQEQMNSNYKDVQKLDKDDNLAPEKKVQMWQGFSASFKDDNPFCRDDEELRSKAAERLVYWNDYQPSKSTQSPLSVYNWNSAQSKDKELGIEWIFVKGGNFEMGDTFGEGEEDEKPVRLVSVEDYYLSKSEITVAQYRTYCTATGHPMPAMPSWGWHDEHPIVNVSYRDAVAFCKYSGSRLPSEAEWEYAAREGGKRILWAGTSNESELSSYAWYDANSAKQAHPIARKRANAIGFYDMSGNVWEWCQEGYNAQSATEGSMSSLSDQSASLRYVLRGGSWKFEPVYARVSNRHWDAVDSRSSNYGFRIARSLK